MSSSGPKTPRESGTLTRWPKFAEWAREAAQRLQKKGTWEDVERAENLAKTFEGWGYEDPGLDARLKSIALLYDLRAKAGTLT